MTGCFKEDKERAGHLVFLFLMSSIFRMAEVFKGHSGLRFCFWEVGEFIFKSGEYQNLKILGGEKNTVNNRSWLGV